MPLVPDTVGEDDARDDARERIFAVAEAEFRRVGFHATTMDVVARQAGCSKKTIYKLFESKEALFFLLLNRFKATLKNMEIDPGLPPGPALEDLLFRMAGVMLCEDAISTLRMVLAEYGANPSLVASAERHFGGGIGALERYLALLEQEGGYRFGPTEEAARMLIGMALGAFHYERLVAMLPALPEAMLRARIHKAVAIFLKGCQA
ncbi:TetR/AcrR family transcriptional regulator [Pseudoroseomonas globiformis]|uniref:TetR/AcrR family transcriptional regulator n=1 Tax=Teichococcus globiformis TaxID=2307229 RepID=A0ABV7FWY9_9PROT